MMLRLAPVEAFTAWLKEMRLSSSASLSPSLKKLLLTLALFTLATDRAA